MSIAMTTRMTSRPGSTRGGEAAGLRRKDLDLKHSQIRVQRVG